MPGPRNHSLATAAVSRRGLLAGVGLGLAATTCGLAPGAQAAPSARRRGWIESRLARMSLEQKVGQLFVLFTYGSNAARPDARNTAAYGVATPAEVVRKYHLGGVIYFAWADNLPDPVTVARFTNDLQRAALDSGAPGGSAIRIPLTISTDQETGLVARLPAPATVFPGAMALGAAAMGAARSTALTRETYAITGSELRAVGVTNDYAPVADVNVNPANPVIGVRSFSSDPSLASGLVAAATEGLQSVGVSATAKHFPGHGDTDTDSHYGFPVITHTRAEWEQIDAPPFRAAIAAGIDAIMTAHIDVAALDPSGDPATLSHPIVTGVLRGELGFSGVVITDSLRMEGVRQKYGDAEVAVRAIEAGVDVLLDSGAADVQVGAVLAAVRSGRISSARLDESVRRILGMKFDRGLADNPWADEAAAATLVGSAEHRTRAAAITARTVTKLRDTGGLVPLPAGSVYVTGYGVTTTANLAASLREGGRTVVVRQTGTTPNQAAIDTAVAESAAHGVTVVLTYQAFTSAAQQRLVAGLLAAGRRVVVVAVGNPYDIAALPGISTYLATYGSTIASTTALARVLLGAAPAHGRLPVAIPRADDPGTVLFPLGAGQD